MKWQWFDVGCHGAQKPDEPARSPGSLRALFQFLQFLTVAFPFHRAGVLCDALFRRRHPVSSSSSVRQGLVFDNPDELPDRLSEACRLNKYDLLIPRDSRTVVSAAAITESPHSTG